MTMPAERFRAIRWARELLVVVAADVEAPVDIRRRATELQATYPSDAGLRQLIQENATHLPPDVSAPLEAAAALVNDLWPASASTLELRRYVRRHFPSQTEIRDIAVDRGEAMARAFGGVAQWIWPDDDD